MAIARTSILGSRRRTARAATSLRSRSVSTMTGIRVVAGSSVPGTGVSDGVAHPMSAASRTTTATAPRTRRREVTVLAMRAWYLGGEAAPIEPDPLPAEPLRGGVPREQDQDFERHRQPARWYARPRTLVGARQRRDLEHALWPDHDLGQREGVVGECREELPVEPSRAVVPLPALAGDDDLVHA